MPKETRYDEAAITEIFRQAAEAQTEAQNRASAPDGLTLAELQEIGRAAGLSPKFVADAASSLQHKVEYDPSPTFAGVTIGVRRSVELPGPMTDVLWEQLVVDLRQIFEAKGKIHRSGGLREWSNGNLHVLVEPTQTGHRLRMGTLKGGSRELISTGIAFSIAFLISFAAAMVDGGLNLAALIPILLIAMASVGATGFSLLRLSSWRNEREEQMVTIGRRALERAGGAKAAATASQPVDERAKVTGAVLDLDATNDAFEEAPSSASGADRTRA
ncbi:MAG: hypothetical protein ACI80V_002206 [Rhodothermales bacterium]|jgi:hypothetical protein